MTKLRVVHYLNQFFAGLGGEERANEGPREQEGPIGPGKALAYALGEAGDVVATVSCGDNAINENGEAALETVLQYIGQHRPDLVVAGPAFNAGRYGLACGRIATAVQERLGVPTITGMYPENPAVEIYRSRLYIVPTGASAATMGESIGRMVSLGLRLARRERIGPPGEDGYIPRGLRFATYASQPGAVRAVDMLLKRLRGEPFETELPLPMFDRVPPPAAIKDLGKATVALVTSGGIVPRGNPGRLESTYATKWLKYGVAGLRDLTAQDWQSVHGGYDTTHANNDPDRVVPLDVMRDLEAAGDVGRLFDSYYVTVGSAASIASARRFGQEIAEDLKAAGVDAVIFTAT